MATQLGDDYGTFEHADAQSSNPKPDIIDLIGPAFDRPKSEPAAKTLIICAAPRTGSYELARMLLAAGIGVPHEYFNPNFAVVLASRWELTGTVLAPDRIGTYIAELRCRRAAGDVFATKLQFLQYRNCLCNVHGRALFRDAVVVHLFRADVAAQFASYLRALKTGRYDFSDRATRPPLGAESLRGGGLLRLVNALVEEDAGFRRLFLLAGIRPLFVEFRQFIEEPRSAIEEIARRLAVSADWHGFDKAHALAGAYGEARGKSGEFEESTSELLEKLAFQP